jgi:hypothetical protein
MTHQINFLRMMYGQTVRHAVRKLGMSLLELIRLVGWPNICTGWYWYSWIPDVFSGTLRLINRLFALMGTGPDMGMDSTVRWPWPLRMLEHSDYKLTEA